MDEQLCYQILHEYKIHNADILIKEDIDADDLIDLIEGNRKYVKCVYVYNKVDVCSMEEVDQIARTPMSVPISCYQNLNLDGLLARLWEELALVRVYTKRTGSKPDFTEPVVLTHERGGTTVEEMCRSIHASLVKDFAYALVWGTSVKHSPQRVGLTHELHDEDVVQIVKVAISIDDGGKGRFKQTSDKPLKLEDRKKKEKLKT